MPERISAFEEIEEEAPRPRRWPVPLSALTAAAVIVFQLWLLGSWIRAESRPPSWDQSVHLETAKDYAELLSRGDLGGLLHQAPKPGMQLYPPLYCLTLLPWMSAPDPATAALWANAFWLVLLVGSVWGLGMLMAGPWEAGAAALLISCAPVTQELMRQPLLDLPLAAMVAAGYLSLVWSAGFSEWAGSLAFGACAALAMLTKFTAWTYFLPAAWMLARALRARSTRWRALAALALAVVGCVWWYAAQKPILLQRVFEGAADRAVPVWRGLACLNYFLQMAEGLEAPLWARALAALFAHRLRKGRDDSWLVTAWFVTSLVFWTVVPNRQLRYLYPGLAPLFLFVPGIFPKALTVLACVWQLFSAANFTHAWIRPIVFEPAGVRLPFLSSSPPVREDWKITEILKAAESRIEPGRPFANLTLVANHERFNCPTFQWIRRRDGTLRVNIRGVNRRYCELSDFVLIKQGSLGPAGVVNQLPDVRQDMLDPHSWFVRGYEVVATIPLPEGEAVLFQRRRRPAPPFKSRQLRFDALETPDYSARGLTVAFGPWDPKRGVYESAELSARSLWIRGLEIRDVKARLEGLDLVPLGLESRLEDVRLLHLDRLTLESALVTSESVASWLAARVPALSRLAVTLDGSVRVEAVLRERLPLSAEVVLTLGEGGLKARLAAVKIAGASLPLPRQIQTYRLSFAPNPELPFELAVPGITPSRGRLTIP